jgi:hypothetical protein
MLSHQPEVSRLLHNEHTARLAQDAQQPMQMASLPAPRWPRAVSRIAAVPRFALSVRHRHALAGR